jgi:copper resistance protein B
VKVRVGIAAAFVAIVCATGCARAQDMNDLTTQFSMLRSEIDLAAARGGALVNWNIVGWYGGDTEKLWLTSQGEERGDAPEDSEVEALYSRNISDFWDFQAGLRRDFAPVGRSYVAIGFEGLAPLFFETGAHAFVSDRGDLSARLEQSVDLALTQQLIAEPHVQFDASASDVPAERLGSGLSDVALGLQLRYEIVRKFGPYIDLVWTRGLGDTAGYLHLAGEPASEVTVRAGLRFWF